MKKIFNTRHATPSTDIALLIARLGIGAMMLTHGLPKLAMFMSGAPVKFPPLAGLSPEFSLGLAIFAEVFCSILLVFGVTTRLATVPLIITMIVALALVHAGDPFATQEPALHYLLVYLVLLFAGAGKYSVDRFWQARRRPVRGDNPGLKQRPLALQP